MDSRNNKTLPRVATKQTGYRRRTTNWGQDGKGLTSHISTSLDNYLAMYRSRVFFAVLLVVVINLVGTIGYYVIEDWTLLDALYMTVITLTTVGFGETHDLSPKGRIFTIVLLLSSMGTLGYAISSIASFVIEGHLNDIIRGRRMSKHIASLKDHIILCGGGRTGKHIAIEFHKTHIPFIIIEQNEEVLEALQHHIGDFPYLMKDATDDDTLIEAGIQRARGLIAGLGDDKDNVFIVLSARALNANLRIVARANEEENQEKLRKAGANEFVSPNAIGGLRIASLMVRPTVVAFLDEMMRVTDQILRFEEVNVADVQGLAGKTLAQSHIGRRTGLLVVAIRGHNGTLQFNPGGRTVLNRGDVLIVLGTSEQVAKLHDVTGSERNTTLEEILDSIEGK